MAKNKAETIANYQEMFSTSTNLTAEQKEAVLNDVTAMADERAKKITELKDELGLLYEEIKNKGVENSSEERERIQEIYEELAKEEIRSVTKSKNEQEALLENLSKNKSKITSKTIEDTIQKLNEERDKAAKYKTDIELTGKEMTAEQKQQYDLMVADAEDYKNRATQQYENLRNGGIKRLYEAFPELTREIDIETGKQLSFFRKLFAGAAKNERDINNLHYDDKTYTIERNEVTNKITNYLNRTFGAASEFFSHRANGLDYVPHDGYRVHLHRGERVLTEKENKEYSSGGKGNININIEKVENNTKEDVRNLVRRIGDEIKRQNIGRGQTA